MLLLLIVVYFGDIVALARRSPGDEWFQVQCCLTSIGFKMMSNLKCMQDSRLPINNWLLLDISALGSATSNAVGAYNDDSPAWCFCNRNAENHCLDHYLQNTFRGIAKVKQGTMPRHHIQWIRNKVNQGQIHHKPRWRMVAARASDLNFPCRFHTSSQHQRINAFFSCSFVLWAPSMNWYYLAQNVITFM